uniref:Stereocilin LRR domain-containing protein n=1 Tax=Myripristis murdjan TaxID=586833 RepID=A0A667Y6Y1_9TELE
RKSQGWPLLDLPMGAELEESEPASDEEQLWEKVLQSFIQSEGSATLNQWNGRVPPRPSVRLQDWFLSLRGSPHWDWLLGLLQSLIALYERQPHKSLLAILSQNWRTVSAVLETVLQAMVSGTYGQASAGLQGFICALKGRGDCAFNVSWLQQLLLFLETRNWKPVVTLHPADDGAEHSKATSGRDDLESLQSLLLQALSRSGGGERAGHLASKNPALVQSLDGLRRGLLHRVGSSVYSNLRKKVSRVTMALLDDVDVPRPNPQGRCSVGEYAEHLGIKNNVTWNTQALGFSSQGLPSTPPFLSCPSTEGDKLRSSRTPSHPADKTPPSSRTNGSVNPAVGHMGLDLRATCSDAAWYLSAAEEDFFWVHVCSEFFAHEFNNTVCANSSFCGTNSLVFAGAQALDENCLAQLGSRSLTAQDFRHCFLPNNSALISALCGSPSPHHTFPEGSWAAAYCSKIHNFSHADITEETCHYRRWAVHDFTNSSLLELCGHTNGFREYICRNVSLYHRHLKSMPQFSEVCADLEAELEGRKCLLQRLFDMLPAPYEFDTSQLCVNPAPLLAEALHKLSVCEVEGGERGGFLLALGYVLRVLDFMVGLSSGLEEGEREARQGLGQAILLSSLLDNTSFWATLQPEASVSVLHTVGLFLRREQNPSLKEDLLSSAAGTWLCSCINICTLV